MGLEVHIIAGPDKQSSSISASGSVQHVITDDEQKSFGIATAPLKAAVGKSFGKVPNDVFVKSPTPWGDLYKTYGWQQVTTVLIVDNSQLLDITSQPTILATRKLENDSSQSATFHADISETVADTVTSSWSQTNTIQVGQKVTYQVNFVAGSVGGETSLNYSNTWGEGGSHSKTTTVGSSAGVSVTLDAHQKVLVELTASRGALKARIFYRAYLTGYTAVNYNPTWKKHHFWALPIGSVMKDGGIPNGFDYTEDIEVGYYSNASVILKDPETGAAIGKPVMLDHLTPTSRSIDLTA